MKITVRHPETGGEFETTEAAFHSLWESKGWIRADDQSATAPAPSNYDDAEDIDVDDDSEEEHL